MRRMFERSEETDALIELFRHLSVGVPMSFESASTTLGFPVTSTLTAYHSARRIAARKHNLIVEAVVGFGFVRLASPEIVARGGKHLRSIRRRARRGAQEMEIAIGGNLDRATMLRASEQLNRFRITESTAQPVRTVSNRPTTEPTTALAPVEARQGFQD